MDGMDSLVLYMDSSEKSRIVKEELDRSGCSYHTIIASSTAFPVPTLESDLWVLRGFDLIQSYLVGLNKSA